MSAAHDGAGASPTDWDAATYDRIADPMTRWGAEVLGRLDLRGDETVLDAGAGSGRVTEMLLERLSTGGVVAFDAAPSMLAEARKRLDRFADRVRFVEGDLLELSPDVLGRSAPVDAVLSTATFHWVLDHDRLFANLAAVMRPGAVLEAQCGADGNIAGLIEAVRTTGPTAPARGCTPRRRRPGSGSSGRGSKRSRCGRTPSPRAWPRVTSSRPTSRPCA